MPTDPKLLTLMQWLSPAYPLGSFAYSHGLEAAIRRGWITDAAGLKDWLEDVLLHGTGRNDAILLHAAHGARDTTRLHYVDAVARASAASAERRMESERQGAAFARTTTDVWGMEIPELSFPVAVGWAARQAQIDAEVTAMLFAQGFASNLVSAAQRLMPLGQTDGQRLLSRLAPACRQIAMEAREGVLDDLYSTAFLSDVASLSHETLEPRIFQS